MNTTALHLSILPDAQRALWPYLHDIPAAFTLYGGTAIALQLGHRISIDFDFFAFEPLQHHTLLDMPLLSTATVLQQEKNTLTCLVHRPAPVKISFFGLPTLRPLKPALSAADNRLPIASLLDLAATKASVVQQRSEAKDYLDIDALMHSGISLPMALAAAGSFYGARFNPQVTLKALSYFGDGDLDALPDNVKQRIVTAVYHTDLAHLPNIV